MKIRKTKLEDKKQVRKILFDLLLHDLPFDDTLDPKWTRTKRWDEDFKNIINDKGSLSIVAVTDGKVVGYLSGVIIKTPVYIKQLYKIASIETIFVNEENRRKGVGGKLVDEFGKWALENRCNMTTVIPNFLNKTGNNFYKKLGFVASDIIYQKKLNK